MEVKLYYSRDEMKRLNIEKLESRGVTVLEIAEIAYKQQLRYNKNIDINECILSVEKILSLRDTFHLLQLGAEIDRLAEEGLLKGPIQDIIFNDLGVFGVDEIFGLDEDISEGDFVKVCMDGVVEGDLAGYTVEVEQ